MRIKKKQERLNVLLLGASGTGKTSFLRTLAGRSLEALGEYAEYKLPCGDKDVHFYDARGYGTQQNTLEKFSWIDAFIRHKYREYLRRETQVHRDLTAEDTRIHLVIVFLSVSSAGIKEYDIHLLQMLHEVVNVIVVVPKADYYAEGELETQKEKIRDALRNHSINLFDLEEEEIPGCALPLSIVTGSPEGKHLEYDQRSVAYGSIAVDNKAFSDYTVLKSVITRARNDLIETTHAYFYEKYRRHTLGADT